MTGDSQYRRGDAPSRTQLIGRFGGVIAAIAIALFFDPPGLSEEARLTAAAAVLMGTWWMTEAIPPAATAFLPLILFPIAGAMDMNATAARYAHPIIYLFFGGFVVALAIERCGLHQRIALKMVRRIGSDGRALVAGFMLAAALLSMWISNTSTTLMLVPIALSITLAMRRCLPELGDEQRVQFEAALLLGVAYGATIGGVATLVGTPPNALMAGFLDETYGLAIPFAQWMLVGLPATIILLPIAWWVLTRLAFRVDFHTTPGARAEIERLHDDLGPAETAEKRVAMLFLALVAAWVLRAPFASLTGITVVTDTTIAMSAALLAFLIPAGSRPGALMDWEEMKRMPWGVLVLFGGGLALAGAMSESGLSAWIGSQLAPLAGWHIALLVVAACALVISLTEFTSNLATTATFLPVMAAIAGETGHDPLLLIVPVTLAASCAFMLPVATAPNAIVYSSGKVTTAQMIRAGVLLNIMSVAVISAIALLLVPEVLG